MMIKLSCEAEKVLRLAAKKRGVTLTHHCESIMIREYPREDFFLTISEAQQSMTMDEIIKKISPTGIDRNGMRDIFNYRTLITKEQSRRVRRLLFPPSLKKNMLVEILNHVPLSESKSLYQLLESGGAIKYGVELNKDRLFVASTHPHLVAAFRYCDLLSLPYIAKGVAKWMEGTTRRCFVFEIKFVERMMNGTDNDTHEIEFI